jgi:hypothetical protein
MKSPVMPSPVMPSRALAPTSRPLAAAFLLLVALQPLAGRAADLPTLDDAQRRNWQRFWEEQQALELLLDLSAEHRPETLAIVGATLIPMTGERSIADAVVVVAAGRITAAGPRSGVEIPEGAEIIDGTGRFLIPGLTEGHSHTIHSPSQLLVYLTRGVTTLREMDGYPWMLEARRKAEQGELLMPSLLVAGHILSNRAWDFYMTQVDTPGEARRLVAEQAAAGYDFIKIHNSLPEPLWSAVFQAAHEAGLDVVGHIPNEITIAQAVADGMRTNEHFKGYLFDQTLEITEQDYVAATRGSDLWNAPTFATYHDHLRGAEALEVVERESSLRLVPRWMRRDWLEQAEQPMDKLTALRQTIYPKSREIFQDLRPVTDKFFAGTDTGSYAMMVPGYALQEEVRIFEGLGLTPFEALETATVHAATAMRRDGEFGVVAPGARGDLLLLGSNPLEGTAHLADIRGVAVRGTWLDRAALDEIEERLSLLFSDRTPIPEPTRPALEALVTGARRIRERGFPYPGYILDEIGDWLSALGQEDLGRSVRASQPAPMTSAASSSAAAAAAGAPAGGGSKIRTEQEERADEGSAVIPVRGRRE